MVMKKSNSLPLLLPLLLADDLAPDQEKRSEAVQLCAEKLARKLAVPIALIHVEDYSLYPLETLLEQPLLQRHCREQQALLTRRAGAFQVPTKAIFLEGEPTKKIISATRKRGAYELLILGTQGRTGLNRLILGSVAEEIIRHAKIPVMTVSPAAQKNTRGFLSNKKVKILVPTLLAPNSIPAENYGIALARKLGAEVIFFHSMHEALHPVLQTASSLSASRDHLRDIKQSLLKELAEKEKKAKGVSASSVLHEKNASSSSAILKEAKRVGADLIIMGTHGRSGISSAFFGRTARDVILGASIPVITVHSKH